MATKFKTKKNLKNYLVAIISIIIIINMISTFMRYSVQRVDFNIASLSHSQEFAEKLNSDFENYILEDIVYQASSKNLSGFISKLNKIEQDELASIKNESVFSLGDIRHMRADILKEFCNSLGFDMKDWYKEKTGSEANIDDQPAITRANQYKLFIESQTLTADQRNQFDSIMTEQMKIEEAELKRLDDEKQKVKSFCSNLKNIAMGTKKPQEIDLGYNYVLSNSNGTIVAENKSHNIVNYMNIDNNRYEDYIGTTIFTDRNNYYGINDHDLVYGELLGMLVKDWGAFNISIDYKQMQKSGHPLNEVYVKSKPKNNDYNALATLIIKIVVLAFCIVALKKNDSSIFKIYRKVPYLVYIVLGISIVLIAPIFFDVVLGGNIYYFMSLILGGNYYIVMDVMRIAIMPVLMILIASDLGFIIDNGFKERFKADIQFIKKIGGKLKFNYNFKSKDEKRNYILKCWLYTAMIIFTAIGLYIFNAWTWDFIYNHIFAGAIVIFSILSVAVIIYLALYNLRLSGDLNDIKRATADIANGNFEVQFKCEKCSSLDEIRKNIKSIDNGFKIAMEDELKSERMKAELITNVSHDLKTPLTSIINYVDLLQMIGVSEEERSEYLKILDNKSKRLKILIEDLFEASKASTGNITLNMETIDIVSVLRQTVAEFREKIDSSNLDFKIAIPDNKIYLELDGARMWRVFENLIGNALKYSMNSSRVYISLLEQGDKVVFEIKNISGYELNCDASELKERFKRADLSRNTEGSGLGLSIANSLVELQGGNLDISIDGDLFKVKVIFNK